MLCFLQHGMDVPLSLKKHEIYGRNEKSVDVAL